MANGRPRWHHRRVNLLQPSSASLAAEHVPFFSSLTPAGQRRLVTAAEHRAVRPKTELVGEGEACRALLFVVSGHLRVYKSSPSGREITLYRVHRHDLCVIGMACALADTPYPATLVAPVSTELIALPTAAFRQLFDEEPGLRQLCLGQTSGLVSALMTLVAEVAFRRMDERLATFLLDESARAGGVVTWSHDQIAAHLGTAREVVSRLLENFKDDGWITSERRQIAVLDRGALGTLGDRSVGDRGY